MSKATEILTQVTTLSARAQGLTIVLDNLEKAMSAIDIAPDMEIEVQIELTARYAQLSDSWIQTSRERRKLERQSALAFDWYLSA